MRTDELRLDGNALAGALRDLFAFEATAAEATCARCGMSGPIGTLLVYAHGMGAVARCPGCDAPMLRMARRDVRSRATCWFEMTGVSRLRVSL